MAGELGGVFSVSKSQEAKSVKKYVAGQAEHHKKEIIQVEVLLEVSPNALG